MKALTQASHLVCDHGGRVQLAHLQSFVRIEGSAVLVLGDTLLKPILGCPNLGPTIKPCTVTLSVEEGPSSFVHINGLPVMVSSAQGGTDGTPPMASRYKVSSSMQDLVELDG